jgi:hypothetical protein
MGLAVAGLIAGAGCAIRPISGSDDLAARGFGNSFEVLGRRVPDGALVLDVPFDRQQSEVSCGAHALASVIRYWRADSEATGAAIFAGRPPADMEAGYSVGELIDIARAERLAAYGVVLPEQGVVGELELGRPVLVPLRLPSIWLQNRTLFDPDFAPIGQIKTLALERVGAMSELMDLAMGSHYVLVVGHADDRFVLLDPIMGYRTISRRDLQRFRAPFGDAAIVFSRQAPSQEGSSAP